MHTRAAWVVILLAAPAILAETFYFMRGNLSRVDSNDNYTTCTFTFPKEHSPSKVRNKLTCSFLLRALQHGTPVGVKIYVITHSSDDGPTTYSYWYGVGFLDRAADWPADATLGTESCRYQLAGAVESVYYDIYDRCYVAVDTGYDVRHNKVFHSTADRGACETAISAFHRGEGVVLVASAAREATDSNTIISLVTTKCV